MNTANLQPTLTSTVHVRIHVDDIQVQHLIVNIQYTDYDTLSNALGQIEEQHRAENSRRLIYVNDLPRPLTRELYNNMVRNYPWYRIHQMTLQIFRYTVPLDPSPRDMIGNIYSSGKTYLRYRY